MDWTWRLDGVIPLAVELAAILGGVVALLSLLAGGLSLLGRRLVRAVAQLALALALTLAFAGYEEAALLTVVLPAVAGLGAAVVAAIVAARRRLRWPALRAGVAAGLVLAWDGSHTAATIDWPALTLALACFGGLGLVLVSLAFRRWTGSRALVAAWAVWLAVGGLLAGWSRFKLRLADRRAGVVIEACRRFESDHQRLPASLDELVPAYILSVPRANWTILGHFVYEPERRALSFLDPWPFERTYFVAIGAWEWHRLFGASDDDGASGRGAQDAGSRVG
jgi:hypothetical protein